jgi:hypothetical protein
MNKKLKAGIKRFFSVLLICILTALIPSFYFLYSMHSNKCNDLRIKTQELVELAKEKGTPILKETAKDLLENVVKVSKETIKKLDSTEK